MQALNIYNSIYNCTSNTLSLNTNMILFAAWGQLTGQLDVNRPKPPRTLFSTLAKNALQRLAFLTRHFWQASYRPSLWDGAAWGNGSSWGPGTGWAGGSTTTSTGGEGEGSTGGLPQQHKPGLPPQ